MSRRWRWLVGAMALLVGAISAAIGWLRRRTSNRVREIPFSLATSRGRVGPDWAERTGHAGKPVDGEVDEFTEFGSKRFDAEAVAPEIQRFYEETAAHDMAYTVRWHRGFRTGAWLASHLTSRLEQLNLPGRSGDGVRRLESRVRAVPADVDPREAVVWTRTDPDTGEAVFVAVYARHEHEGETHSNVAVPLPFSNLSTVLRPQRIPTDSDGDGVAFTTMGAGDGGLYLVTPLGPLDLPMDQTFRVWPAGADDAPDSPVDGADLVATHEMWICGRQFLTITYGIQRAEEQ